MFNAPSVETLIRIGAVAELIGIPVLLIVLFVSSPLAMLICAPLGSTLVGVGLLAWLWAFVRTL